MGVESELVLPAALSEELLLEALTETLPEALPEVLLETLQETLQEMLLRLGKTDDNPKASNGFPR